MRRSMSNEEIIASLQAWTEKHGRPPRLQEWRHVTKTTPSAGQVVKRWGTWNAALRAAGLPYVEPTGTGNNREQDNLRVCTACLSEIVRPLLRVWEKRYSFVEGDERLRVGGWCVNNAWKYLSEESRVSGRQLSRIISCEHATTGFLIADRLLSEGFNRPDLIHSLGVFEFAPRRMERIPRGSHVCHLLTPAGFEAGSIESSGNDSPYGGGSLKEAA